MSKSENGNVPVQTLRSRRIKAAIWSNQGAKGVFYTVTVTRSFKQGEEWHDSHSFSQDELLIVAKLMYDAHTAISALMIKDKASALPGERASIPPPAGRRRVKA